MNFDDIKKAIESFLNINKEHLVSNGVFKFEVDTNQKKIHGEIINKQKLKTIKMSKSS